MHFGRVTNLRKEGRGGGENVGEREKEIEREYSVEAESYHCCPAVETLYC